ncbi:MAG: hypothetical protein Q4D82_08245, partial [Neisseria sp.]|nr:hypothetical protein [Neisseria sp.]
MAEKPHYRNFRLEGKQFLTMALKVLQSRLKKSFGFFRRPFLILLLFERIAGLKAEKHCFKPAKTLHIPATIPLFPSSVRPHYDLADCRRYLIDCRY